MLPADHRLTHRKDFGKVMQKGKYATDRVLTVKIVNNNLQKSWFGFIISTKVSKRAVVRNRIRRRLREIVRLHRAAILGGYDVAIMASQAAIPKTYQELEQSLASLMHRVGLLIRK